MKQAKTIGSVVATLMLGSSLGASAATVAWWNFEQADVRPATVTLTSSANAPTLNATLGASGSTLSSNVAAPGVQDGVGGPIYANTQSLNQNGGDTNVLNVAGATSLLNNTFVDNASSWTFETFVFMPTGMAGSYGELFGNGTPTGQGIQFDMGSDSRHFRFISNGAVLMQVDSLPAFDLDTWYHLALTATYNAGAWDLAFFINYTQINSASGVQLSTSLQDYTIASPLNSFGGSVDEMRVSNTALTTDEMLHTSPIPEPSTSLLMGAGLLLVVAWKKRRSARC